MGQQSSTQQPNSTSNHTNIQTNEFRPSFRHSLNYQNIHSFQARQRRKSLSIKKQKKHRIFQEWIPLNLPLVSKTKEVHQNDPNATQEKQSTLNQRKTNQPNYLSQKYMKNSFFVFENQPSKKVPKIQRLKLFTDENRNPNKTSIHDEQKSKMQKQFRKTFGSVVDKQIQRGLNGQSNFEYITQKKRVQEMRRLGDSIIDQWFEEGENKGRYQSEGIRIKRKSKNKKCKVEKASGIFSKNILKARNQESQGQGSIQEEEILIEIANLSLLQSRDQ